MSKQDDFWNNSFETDDDPDKNVAVEVYNHIIIVFSPFSNISDRLIERAFEMSVTDYPYGEFSKDNNIVNTSIEELKYIKLNEEFFKGEIRNRITFFNCLCNWSQTADCHIVTKKDDSWSVYSFKNSLLWQSNDGSVTKVSYEEYANDIQEQGLSMIEDDDVTTILDNHRNRIYRLAKLVIRNNNSEFNQDQLKGGMLYAELLISNFTSNETTIIPYANDLPYKMMPYPTTLSIPIMLKKQMPKYNDLWGSTVKDDRYIPSGKVLGYYTRGNDYESENKPFCMGPHIVLCPENIQAAIANQSITFEILFAEVLIHELAHAIMDKYRIITEKGIEYTDLKANRISTLESRAMEESLANMITLECFNKYATPNDLTAVEEYIKTNQNSIYKFGINQKRANVDWKKWKDSSKNMSSLKEWFNVCFENGNIKTNLSSQEVKSAYDKVFLPQ